MWEFRMAMAFEKTKCPVLKNDRKTIIIFKSFCLVHMLHEIPVW